nr:DUF2252 family protein [uncultured Halomonas sp.]
MTHETPDHVGCDSAMTIVVDVPNLSFVLDVHDISLLDEDENLTGGRPFSMTRKQSKRADSKKAEAQPAPARKLESRVEAFRQLADAYANGACVMLPGALSGQARHLHVRATLQEDHQTRIEERSSGASEKFDKLAGSVFSFFRGTALLFYRDMAGTDAHMPTVLVLGDVHPENFGVMPNADNVPIFNVNDFDEACYAPFSWDLKRGSVGFMLAAEEVAGFGHKRQRKIVKRFLAGYMSNMRRLAESSTEKAEEYRIDNSPKVIRRLFKQAHQSREEWLWDDYLDESGKGFRSSKKLTPISHRRDEFQKLVEALVNKGSAKPPARAGNLAVKDVAIRHGQGTASLGLPRYYVLIEGPSQNATDDIIIEFKRARDSALSGLVPRNEFSSGARGVRIAHGQSVQLAHGDVFYGSSEIDGVSFMTRERAPFRDDIDLESLSKKSWGEYAEVCGCALALAHARSDDAGEIDYDVEPRILDAINPSKLFARDILNFAQEAAERLRGDHAYFCADHKRGAFRNIEMVYR